MSETPLFGDLPEGEAEAGAAQREWAGRARLREPVRDQIEWRMMDLDALLAAEHPARVIWAYVLPNVITASIVYAMADIALYIGLAAALSFLGLGAKPPEPEWGAMITEGQAYITTAWWMSVFPGLAMVITGIGLSLIGDGLADVMRPGG